MSSRNFPSRGDGQDRGNPYSRRRGHDYDHRDRDQGYRGYNDRYDHRDHERDRDRRDRNGANGGRHWERRAPGGFPSRPRDRDRDRDSIDRDRHRSRDSPSVHYSEEVLNSAKPLDSYTRASLWDKVPEGFEKIPASRAKASGIFPAPGEVRNLTDIKKLLQLEVNGRQSPGVGDDKMLAPALSRAAKRCIIRESQPQPRELEIVEFLKEFIFSVKGSKPKIKSWKSPDNKDVIVEFGESELATLALALNGLTLPELSTVLTVTRPGEYVLYPEDEISNTSKLILSNIPLDHRLLDVKDALVPAGSLKSFNLLTDLATGDSKGIAFIEFEETDDLDERIEKTTALSLGEKPLICFKAFQGPVQKSSFTYETMVDLAGSEDTKSLHKLSRVLVFLQCIAIRELVSPITYEEVQDDFYDGCAKHGKVELLHIPRPSPTYKDGDEVAAEVGNVYVKFDTEESAKAALEALGGRLFGGRSVIGAYFDEKDFDLRLWKTKVTWET
ncbi:unnamed protein product [Kuraishia capsulata CBS 1993]|uniref:RRM domain-containing protein n=1 Tax=Kuraishia capsulata CBS 1993 TaxID=1382522 RepID=W6MS92_9ASCO|nr:uncharacterized protein KUCA_T00005256001 [Kuraishia capsulata CBS 1993]CDK29268.1 unnamed protein product [Kuraishia capsulata CBS 1993]